MIGQQARELLEKLFSLNRSITGAENERTLELLSELIPLQIHEVPSGTQIFDWTVPSEWHARGASIRDAHGDVIVDFCDNNLHLVNFSSPISRTVSLEELRDHLWVGTKPDEIPYRTSYYETNWGFCVTPEQAGAMEINGGPFQVHVDTDFHHGSLLYADLVVEGASKREILVSTYFCHPSMANDNLSGVVTTTFLAKWFLEQHRPQKTMRFVFVPETIGAIAYLHDHERLAEQTLGGLVVTTCAGKGPIVVKQSWDPDHFINKTIKDVLNRRGQDFRTIPFDTVGSDERQYSSPGYRINMSTVGQAIYYQYPEYHTSLDNLDFVEVEGLQRAFDIHRDILLDMDSTPFYRRVIPEGEPMLSRRRLYETVGGGFHPSAHEAQERLAISRLLFWADGSLTCEQLLAKAELGQLDGQHLLDKLVEADVLIRE